MINDKYGNKYYKVALHVHTTRSDGRRTPKEAALEYKSMGYASKKSKSKVAVFL